MAEAISVARPYAVAAFDEASKLADLKGWSAMLLAGAEAVVNPEVHALISSPRVAKSQLENLMEALCGGKLSTIESNFIKLLVENQRLDILPEIASMTSAFDLDEAQKQKISAAMKKRMGRDIRLSCKTDRELLGGIIIRAGDKVIDGSARTKLSELATALA